MGGGGALSAKDPVTPPLTVQLPAITSEVDGGQVDFTGLVPRGSRITCGQPTSGELKGTFASGISSWESSPSPRMLRALRARNL
jgi:hypothetical protein